MRGEEDRFLAFLAEVAEVLHEKPSITRVQAQGEIIEDEQFGILRHEQPQRHLRTLPVGHLAEELIVFDLQEPHEFVIGFFVPPRIERRIEPLYLLDGHKGVLHVSLQEQSYTCAFLIRHRARVVAQEATRTGIGLYEPREDIDGRGLSGAVLT